jgi:hypothetical protein
MRGPRRTPGPKARIVPGASLADPTVLDALLVWRLKDPRFGQPHEGDHPIMQKQFTLEFRVDFADEGRYETARKAVMLLAKHGLAELQLIAQGDANGQQPQVASYSDDYFATHDEIDAMEDVIAQAKEKYAHLTKPKDDTASGVSDDMAEALREMRETKAANDDAS